MGSIVFFPCQQPLFLPGPHQLPHRGYGRRGHHIRLGLQTHLEKSFCKGQLDANLAVADQLRTIHYWGYSIYKPVNMRDNHTGETRPAEETGRIR